MISHKFNKITTIAWLKTVTIISLRIMVSNCLSAVLSSRLRGNLKANYKTIFQDLEVHEIHQCQSLYHSKIGVKLLDHLLK